jgi:hypothetical protein
MADDSPLSSLAARAEPDAMREAQFQQAIDHALTLGQEINRVEQPARFSLLELMIVVTLLAVMLGLIRSLGMWGAALSFVGAAGWTQLIYPRWHVADRSRQRTMFDCVWGLVMPTVCLVADPFVFKDQPELIDRAFDPRLFYEFSPRLRKENVVIYTFIGWQMLLLFTWIVGRSWLSRGAGAFFGTWIVGAVFAGVLGILLAPIAAIGSIVGIGLLGFTPLFTTYALARRLREAIDDGVLDASDQSVSIFWLFAAFGFMGAWIVPLQLANWLGPLISH